MNPTFRGLVAANYLAQQLRFRVFPVCGVDANGEGVCFREHCTESTGKHPLIRDWKEEATWDRYQIGQWWKRWPEANIGIATGQGIFVLDVDPIHGGEDSLEDHESIHGKLPDTLLVETGGGGWHYYFKTDRRIRNGCNTLGAGIDIRGEGGFVVGPGSRHASGRWYEFETFTTMGLAAPPRWLLKELTKKKNGVTTPRTSDELPDKVQEGGRNNFLFSEALYHKVRSFSRDRTIIYLEMINQAKCDPPVAIDEIIQIVDSVYSHQRRRSNGQG